LDTKISIGDEVVAVNLTTGTTQVASVREFSGSILTLETKMPLDIGDAVKLELEEGLLLGEVVYEHASEASHQVILRCCGWVWQRDVNTILR
jgi:hypothetical protein